MIRRQSGQTCGCVVVLSETCSPVLESQILRNKCVPALSLPNVLCPSGRSSGGRDGTAGSPVRSIPAGGFACRISARCGFTRFDLGAKSKFPSIDLDWGLCSPHFELVQSTKMFKVATVSERHAGITTSSLEDLTVVTLSNFFD